MFVIACPWCGVREAAEFRCGGEAHIVRAADPAALSDEQWADYLFGRTNPKGLYYERWWHAHGCRRWFNVARNTADDRILAVYPMGAPPPGFDRQAPATPCGEPELGSGNRPLSDAKR